ncbi:FAD/FMN-containing dehydrogenase/Fe-S oxidoreductase [Nocardioides massiliensis]|uniref:FAD/FMN-containing dehydrogenase/Fe-S oxidoreductase n=4 Tax=Nocardioides massiliensis TaxID=1325935 RepID=A0ABT9NNZ8_9ACTN|nr:FAD-binding and (Fe-S)-binding domain-containing protein [Nocardioides massiliensis]MDP9822002.1 FAD/FMN-containing dehydrogenase/Fe-S oxidoreductase [Nocardioides massiliensis]
MTATPTSADTRDVAAALRAHGLTDVDDSALARALYSSDASLYRVPPQVVVRPRDIDEVAAVLAAARETGTPITPRGAGTSIAGNAVGPGIVVDFVKHLNRVHHIDPDRRTAWVDPGAVHATLQRAARPHGLRFGPDPSTHTRCTIGGMIGNNACGSRALAYGRTVDNVEALEVLTVDGRRLRVGPGAVEPVAGLDALVDAHLAEIRTRFGQFSRQVSGYSFEHLLPENGRRADRFLVGSEGTLAVVVGAEMRLVADAPHRAMAVLGYPSMPEAADAVPGLLPHPLTACEGLDDRLVSVLRARPGAGPLPELPQGAGWLFTEVTGDTEAEALALAEAVCRDAGTPHTRIVTGPAEQAALWRIREDGAGLAARSLSRPAHAGWEDAAVPPERLGAYLRDFDALLRQHHLDGVPYGHFGDGCIHVRIDFELEHDAGRVGFRRFVEAAADLAASYGGSFSGEHGDGRARSELLPRMYDDVALALFAQAKRLFDPQNLLNPGNIADPAPFDVDIRLAASRRESGRTFLRLTHDGGSIDAAAHRCTGVGKCIADNTGTGGVMCPSYQATRNEKDSTRGRARVLQEMLVGDVVGDGWADDAVHEALDLCLSCKGCASDCPTGIDMATYKAEALHQRYRRRLRPRSHYALGQLPRWARMTTGPLAPVANAVLRSRAGGGLAKSAAGVDRRRSLPAFVRRSFRRVVGGSEAGLLAPLVTELDGGADVWVWADTFTDSFTPGPGLATVRVLQRAGLRVGVVTEPACCGLTWISTGQLTGARRILSRTIATLAPYAATGAPIVGVEPSCLAVLRHDAAELVDDPRVAEVAGSVRTLAEHLTSLAGWTAPDLSGRTVVAQPHCHHASVLGWSADDALLRSTGADVRRVGGCCGLAGNFGVEQGHYEVSVAVAEHDLLPAVREAGPEAVVLADGFSCRTQLDDLAGVGSLHLAELLDRHAGAAAVPSF